MGLHIDHPHSASTAAEKEATVLEMLKGGQNTIRFRPGGAPECHPRGGEVAAGPIDAGQDELSYSGHGSQDWHTTTGLDLPAGFAGTSVEGAQRYALLTRGTGHDDEVVDDDRRGPQSPRRCPGTDAPAPHEAATVAAGQTAQPSRGAESVDQAAVDDGCGPRSDAGPQRGEASRIGIDPDLAAGAQVIGDDTLVRPALLLGDGHRCGLTPGQGEPGESGTHLLPPVASWLLKVGRLLRPAAAPGALAGPDVETPSGQLGAGFRGAPPGDQGHSVHRHAAQLDAESEDGNGTQQTAPTGESQTGRQTGCQQQPEDEADTTHSVHQKAGQYAITPQDGLAERARPDDQQGGTGEQNPCRQPAPAWPWKAG